jgi:hypothetical protein
MYQHVLYNATYIIQYDRHPGSIRGISRSSELHVHDTVPVDHVRISTGSIYNII